MNRLILIGNGFDLAHGLKTGYNDFIKWYLTQALESATLNSQYEDELVAIQKEVKGEPIYFSQKNHTEKELVDFFYERGFTELINNAGFRTDGWLNLWKSTFKFEIKSALIKTLLEECSAAKWVDIENEFYNRLKVILQIQHPANRHIALTDANRSLAEIIRLLEMYLNTLPSPAEIRAYRHLITETIDRTDIVLPTQMDYSSTPDSVHILNFNYTATALQYTTPQRAVFLQKPLYINHIHGEINNPANPLVFGFGDELDENYIKLEAQQVRGFLAYIKSFWYFRTSNYHDLIRFIESDEFQVYIFGHSCGLSDRTMLNMIFEHTNCKSIKIFYHQHGDGSNNYTALTQEISRHFRDKTVMRKKIIPLDKSKPMPQHVI